MVGSGNTNGELNLDFASGIELRKDGNRWLVIAGGKQDRPLNSVETNLVESVSAALLAAQGVPLPAGPASMQAARAAIDNAILKGRMDHDPPPQEHWLHEYWQIGHQLGEYGKTGFDNINPPDHFPASAQEAQRATSAADVALEAQREGDPQGGTGKGA